MTESDYINGVNWRRVIALLIEDKPDSEEDRATLALLLHEAMGTRLGAVTPKDMVSGLKSLHAKGLISIYNGKAHFLSPN